MRCLNCGKRDECEDPLKQDDYACAGWTEPMLGVDPLIEHLAAYAHDCWARIVRKHLEGDFLQATVDRWWRQVETDYSDLSEQEKEIDRNEARKMINIFAQYSVPDGQPVQAEDPSFPNTSAGHVAASEFEAWYTGRPTARMIDELRLDGWSVAVAWPAEGEDGHCVCTVKRAPARLEAEGDSVPIAVERIVGQVKMYEAATKDAIAAEAGFCGPEFVRSQGVSDEAGMFLTPAEVAAVREFLAERRTRPVSNLPREGR